MFTETNIIDNNFMAEASANDSFDEIPQQAEITGLVLIVDDTPSNLEVVSDALSDAGFDVAIATSGERALKQLARRLPDLILLDVMMPGIDGFETCRRLKSNPLTADIPIIFMTALNDAENKVKALGMGAVDYITKPFTEKEVLARVRTHIQLHFLNQNLAEQVKQKTAELRASQLQLIQSEKMSALGNLVAGVAHEINNPISCILGNVGATQAYINDLLGLLELYRQELPQPSETLQAELETVDLDYVQEDLPELMRAIEDSGDRIISISESLRTFSRADSPHKQLFDLHEGLNSTLLILRHRLKANELRAAIEVITNYGEIPSIHCFPGQLNQVFMNILANAIDALDEASLNPNFMARKNYHPQILINTLVENNKVKITITDNGLGISEIIKGKIFDHLFTTKAVGKGTGLGLAITHQIVIAKHGGQIDVQSEPGKSTQFCIWLPI